MHVRLRMVVVDRGDRDRAVAGGPQERLSVRLPVGGRAVLPATSPRSSQASTRHASASSAVTIARSGHRSPMPRARPVRRDRACRPWSDPSSELPYLSPVGSTVGDPPHGRRRRSRLTRVDGVTTDPSRHRIDGSGDAHASSPVQFGAAQSGSTESTDLVSSQGTHDHRGRGGRQDRRNRDPRDQRGVRRRRRHRARGGRPARPDSRRPGQPRPGRGGRGRVRPRPPSTSASSPSTAWRCTSWPPGSDATSSPRSSG